MQRPPRDGQRPPQIPGYVLHALLGSGAYGEVWLGENRTTRRQVAVKLLHSRASLDWSLLDAETEKLAFLAADRRVVQLLDVGRDADPPYFVMEYVTRGSLARHLEQSAPLPVDRAAEIFEEIVLGLAQVHGKGILHCDLKPSNILLDDELRPRLADFGQSRMTIDRSPGRALGTMFFMAPEQADLAGVPDARWDIYALGAILHTMLTGDPPHRTDDALESIRAQPELAGRLARYRQIVAGGRPTRLPRAVDRALASILSRCLAPDPRERFATAEEVLGALRARRRARSRRPMMWLGVVGPLVLLTVMGLFAARGYHEAMNQSADAIRRRAFESNKFAATVIARSLEGEVRRYFDLVADEASAPPLLQALSAVRATPELRQLTAEDPQLRGVRSEAVIDRFLRSDRRLALDHHLQQRLDLYLARAREQKGTPRFVGIFVTDAQGTILSSVYDLPTIRTKSVGRYYGWRSYFHGGPVDLPRDTPRSQVRPIERPHLSAPWESSTTNHWRLGISVPLFEGPSRAFAGVLVFAVDVGDFEFLRAAQTRAQDRFAVLVDAEAGRGLGRILFHPALVRTSSGEPQEAGREGPLPSLPSAVVDRLSHDWQLMYEDPLAATPAGVTYRGPWIAAAQPLGLQPRTRLLVLVQERSAAVTGPVEQLGRHLISEGLWALLVIVVTVPALWWLALGRSQRRGGSPRPQDAPAALRDRTTMSETGGEAERTAASSR